MADIDLKKLQSIELEIFKEFVRLCDKHNLTYSLAFGTAIGAIRHKGFIPWDDDIDIIMPRKDYEYFWRVAVKEMDSKYFFQNYHTDKNCGLIFAKIRKNGTLLSEHYSYHVDMHQGVWIDIFPYDNICDNLNERKKINRKISLLRNLYIIKCGFKLPQDKNGFIYRTVYSIAKFLCIFLNKNKLINAIDDLVQKYNDTPTKEVSIRGGIAGKEIFAKETLGEYKDCIFEKEKAKIVKDYDTYLTKLYGDYMQLPPIEKRENGSCHFVKEFKENVD